MKTQYPIHDRMSFSEFLTYQDNHPQPDFLWRDDAGSLDACSHQVNGGITWETAVDLAKNGWPEGCEHMTQIMAESTPTTGRPRPGIEMDTVGVRFSPAHYYAGDADNMMNFVPRPSRRSPVVTLHYMCSMAKTITADTRIRRGAALMSLIDAIEDTGTSVNLSMNYKVIGEESALSTLEITLKTAGQPLDTDRLIFALAHPAFYRRLLWRWREQNRFHNHFSGCYGSPDSSIPNDLDGMGIAFSTTTNENRTIPEIAADLMKQYETYISREV